MTKPKALLVHVDLNPPGGGNAVGAWTLQALQDSYDVDVLLWYEPDWGRINRHFGVRLEPGHFSCHVVTGFVRKALDVLPGNYALMRLGLISRKARSMHRSEHYDVLVCTCNEMDFGEPAVQYIHFPTAYDERPRVDLKWFHQIWGVQRLYRAFCLRLGGWRRERIRRNLTLCNSRYTASLYQATYGVSPRTLSPPIHGDFPQTPWAERDDEFVCLGRIAPEKNLLEVIDIIAAVRQQGCELKLNLVGSPGPKEYFAQVLHRARQHAAWIRLHLDIPRDELLALLARCRYGIHAMQGEHFGMAVAEMACAGNIVFVHDSGGPAEIVAANRHQMFSSPAEAVNRIVTVFNDSRLQTELVQAGGEARQNYSAQQFMDHYRQLLAEFVT